MCVNLVLLSRKPLAQGQPHFSGEQGIQTGTTGIQISRYHRGLWFARGHQGWKTLSFPGNLSYLRILWEIFSCKSQYLSKLESYNPIGTIKSDWSTLEINWQLWICSFGWLTEMYFLAILCLNCSGFSRSLWSWNAELHSWPGPRKAHPEGPIWDLY